MYDINQRFLRLFSGGNGIIYAIQADGVLLWYRHSGWQTGARTWSNGSGLEIGSGWQQFHTVLASPDGQIFAINGNGRMRWYKRQLTDTNTGAGTWHPSSGATIHTGLAGYSRIFGGWDGVIYAIDDAGKLHWLRYLAGNGSNGAGAWAANSGAVIAEGWNRYPLVWAEANGVIYCVHQGGNQLSWSRYLATDGSSGPSAWANSGECVQLGLGWNDGGQKTWFAGGAGVVYTVMLDTGNTPGLDHQLYWFRVENSENLVLGGHNTWVNNGFGSLVGEGFTIEPTAALQGYATELSPRAGTAVSFAVSSSFPSVEASVERLAVSGTTPGVVWGPVTKPGRFQLLPGGYRATGCGWTAQDFSLSIPATWPSGVYACRLRGILGEPQVRFDIPFVIKPVAPAAPIAVLLPTNTYNAYNTWAGHDQYTNGQVGRQRTVTFLRPSNSTAITGDGKMNHTFYTDLLLLRWMVSSGFTFDCYQDGDLDADPSWLSQYRVLVLGSHPEYWTQRMYDAAQDYLAHGGRLINTGGNAIYERVSYDAARDAVVFRAPNGDRQLFIDLGNPEHNIIGVDYDPYQFMNFAPYEVITNHPFLNGTGLSVGDTFGADSYNIGASGWELNRTPTALFASTTVIARGQNGNGNEGADMVFQDKGNGGWVFSASSIAFNGSLDRDAGSSQILRNALTAAIS